MEFALTRIRSTVTFGLAMLYLFNLFLKSSTIDGFNMILMALVLALGLLAVTGTARVIGYFSFIASAVLFIYYHAPLSVWEQALKENLYLVVMFTMVPLLGIPIKHGGYTEALHGVFRRYVHTDSRFYLLVSIITAFVAVLINVATIPLMHQISQASDKCNDKKLLSSAISRGFATCTIWAPTTAAIALILQFTGAQWPLFFPFGLFLGSVAGFVGYVMTRVEEKKNNNIAATPVLSEPIYWRKVIELSVFGFVLIASIAIVSLVTGILTVVVVAMASLIFPVLWLSIIGKLSVLAEEFTGDYFNESLPKLKNEVVLFVGAGLLATGIDFSHLGNYVPLVLNWLVGDNATLFAIVVIFGGLVLAAVGIHPIITVTIVGSTVQAATYHISPTFMALILAMSWAMGISVSPSAANVIAISGLAERSPLHVGPWWNGPYVAISSMVLLLVMFFLRAVGVL